VKSGASKSGAGLLSATAAALICAVAMAGCASSTSTSAAGSNPGTASSTSATPTPSTSVSTPAAAPSMTLTPPPTAPPACPTSGLQVKLGQSSGYAGGVYVPIDFTNTSSASCTLYGYPGVSLVNSSGAQIGLAAERDTTTPVTLVTLAPGATATALLQIVDALNFTPSTCGPTQAANIKVYPPNQTAAVLLPNTSQGCAKPVQTIFIAAVQAQGKAHPMISASGTAQ